jgi:RNA polymerase sigma factor (TIGR02999 family)
MSDVTRLLDAATAGDCKAAAELLPVVYDELRKLAAVKMANERPDHTLDATALVHEAYLRLVGAGSVSDGRTPVAHASGSERQFDHRGHFFAAAAEAMRRILVDNARRKRGPKQGGDRQRIQADLDQLLTPESPVDLLALDEALTKLAAEAPVRAELVKLRFFAGMTMPDAAQALGISLATAERHWTYARTWLFAEMSDFAENDE